MTKQVRNDGCLVRMLSLDDSERNNGAFTATCTSLTGLFIAIATCCWWQWHNLEFPCHFHIWHYSSGTKCELNMGNIGHAIHRAWNYRSCIHEIPNNLGIYHVVFVHCGRSIVENMNLIWETIWPFDHSVLLLDFALQYRCKLWKQDWTWWG